MRFHEQAARKDLRQAVIMAITGVIACQAFGGEPKREAATAFDLGSPAANVSASSGVVVESLDTEMGTFRETFSVRTLPHKGEEVAFDVPFSKGTKSVILEIQEIHNRRPDAFGYTVLVGGKEVYFRTYQELGAGSNHFFVEVPAEMLKEGSPLKIALRHDGGGAFSIGRIWAYEDFFEKVAKPEEVARPMGIFFPSGVIKLEGESEGKKKKGAGVELDRCQKMKEVFSGFTDYAPIGVFAFAGGYGHVDPSVGKKDLSERLRLSSETGLPGLWLINGTGWGGKPIGPDGHGGYFSDIQYTSTHYEPEIKDWRASWPNMWANTPGAALRNPVMNAFLETRFQQMMGGMREELAILRLSGKPAQTLLIREFAPASGEMSQAVIESAAGDGVKIDPAAGMGFDQRLWMHRDAVRSWQEFSDSTARAVGRDIVIVDNGKVSLPEEQVFDNLYSHPDFLTDKPMNDPRWGGGQHGMVDGLWSSGEMGEGVNFRDIAMYDYLRARGKLSMINMERTILKENFSVMKRHYERGFQFLCFFNADPGDEKFVREVDRVSVEPADPPVHRQPALLDVLVPRDFSPGPADKVVSVKNMKVHSSLRLAVADVGAPGELIYKITNAGDPLTSGLALDLDGRISPGKGNSIGIYVGNAPDSMKKIASLTDKDLPDPGHWTPYMTSRKLVDLGDSMVGSKEIYLKLVFQAEHAPDAAFLISLNVQTQWPKRSGYAVKPSLTKGQQRALQLRVQDRAIAERLLKKYRQAGGEDDIYRKAKDHFDRGWYGSTKKLLGGEISEVLPATYLVRGHGRLGRYPLSVKLGAPDDRVFVTLEKAGADGAVFSLKSLRDAQPCTIALEEADPSKGWALRPLGGGRYEIAEAKDGGKKAVFEIEHTNPVKPAPKLPSELAARYLGGNKSRIQVDTQDLALMDYASNMSLAVAKDAVFERRPAGLEDSAEAAKGHQPQKYDEVTLSINDAGEVTKAVSRYGYDKGRIKKFEPPVVIGKPSNGVIEMESGNRYGLMFDKGMTKFDTVALQGTLVAYEITALKAAIKAGHEIELRYTPSPDKDAAPRLLEVRQPRTVLLDVDYTKDTDGSWKKAASEIRDADVRPHKPEPNYLYRVEIPMLRPVEAFKPGSVTYHITSENPLGTTVAEVAARAFDDSSHVTIWTSPDGKTWSRCGQFDNTWQNNISQNLNGLPYQFIDLTPSVHGLKSFYLKMEMAANSADHRFCVAKLRVATEKNP